MNQEAELLAFGSDQDDGEVIEIPRHSLEWILSEVYRHRDGMRVEQASIHAKSAVEDYLISVRK